LKNVVTYVRVQIQDLFAKMAAKMYM